jgi:hypothetical protein
MNLIAVKRFHDFTRQLTDMQIAPETVSAIEEPTQLYGPHGTFTCRQVWFVGGHWFFIEDADNTLIERLKDAKSAL